jgi:hypothetical protein
MYMESHLLLIAGICIFFSGLLLDLLLILYL